MRFPRPTINLTAVGIGGTNPVSVVPGTAATLTTTGTGSAGNITLTTTGALSAFTFDSDNASARWTVNGRGNPGP